jgi:hypothetical protein
MPSGEPWDDACVQLHLDAAEILEESLSDRRDHEQEKRKAICAYAKQGTLSLHVCTMGSK